MSQKEKVLIIEDEESIARFTGTALKRNGYDVLYALSGQEGLSIASSHTRIWLSWIWVSRTRMALKFLEDCVPGHPCR